MTRAVGLASQIAFQTDAESILLGYVGRWDGRAATTKTGEPSLLPYLLNKCPVFKIVGHGATSSAAGGYVVRVGHMARDGALADVEWATIGRLVFRGERAVEFACTGLEADDLARDVASPSIAGGDCRVVAVRLDAGIGSKTITNVALTSNVATVTIGSHTITVGSEVTVACDNLVFNGTFTVTAVSGTTISYAKTNANVSSAAASGTVSNGCAVPAGTGNSASVYFAR